MPAFEAENHSSNLCLATIYFLELSMNTKDIWNAKHEKYKNQSWINNPNIFAKEIIEYFPEEGKILELGAGQGQDTRFLAENGYKVISTDISPEALSLSKEKMTIDIEKNIEIKQMDTSKKFPFNDSEFEIVYAHLAVHYFDMKTTEKIVKEISRVLKPNGIIAILTNSCTDPEYGQGEEIEKDYFFVDGKNKRFFSIESIKSLFSDFKVVLADNLGETYKDSEKGVHNLIRFIGRKII